MRTCKSGDDIAFLRKRLVRLEDLTSKLMEFLDCEYADVDCRPLDCIPADCRVEDMMAIRFTILEPYIVGNAIRQGPFGDLSSSLASHKKQIEKFLNIELKEHVTEIPYTHKSREVRYEKCD